MLAFCCISGAAQPPTDLPLMPWPAHVSRGSGELKIEVGFSAGITGAGSNDPRVKAAVLEAMYHLYRQTGIPVRQQLALAKDGPALLVTVEHVKPGIQKYGDDESYRLTVAPGSVKLVAPEPLGAIRGLQTFLQLVRISPDGFTAPAVDIQDRPRFGWRGLSLDVSRHFIPVSGVKRTLDGMAAVKLNVFHWHLSDDQGFRTLAKFSDPKQLVFALCFLIVDALAERGTDLDHYTEQLFDRLARR